MAKYKAESYQFLSIREPPHGTVRCPARQAGTAITFEFSVIEKQFDISFASIKGRNPDIGAIQYSMHRIATPTCGGQHACRRPSMSTLIGI